MKVKSMPYQNIARKLLLMIFSTLAVSVQPYDSARASVPSEISSDERVNINLLTICRIRDANCIVPLNLPSFDQIRDAKVGEVIHGFDLYKHDGIFSNALPTRYRREVVITKYENLQKIIHVYWYLENTCKEEGVCLKARLREGYFEKLIQPKGAWKVVNNQCISSDGLRGCYGADVGETDSGVEEARLFFNLSGLSYIRPLDIESPEHPAYELYAHPFYRPLLLSLHARQEAFMPRGYED